ncbi:uncharacterized protein BJ212DRAFT_1376006 [Suillus subaureus]|uniref:Uncharacterized protein n=1 Tax=Suillus subaureus TaxID=48587 RepID=A0A9P7E5H7_9AGAM|nr:uncharacterized protein BJ212DRAFT_1376006 [Suillus subaureus]KAG1811272.1 hypothetical protein BJ212DRAFT_1376006 [Suillus subaureus]
MARLRRTEKRSRAHLLAAELEALAICQLAAAEDKGDKFIGFATTALTFGASIALVRPTELDQMFGSYLAVQRIIR